MTIFGYLWDSPRIFLIEELFGLRKQLVIVKNISFYRVIALEIVIWCIFFKKLKMI